jgi:hypothetical protein
MIKSLNVGGTVCWWLGEGVDWQMLASWLWLLNPGLNLGSHGSCRKPTSSSL